MITLNTVLYTIISPTTDGYDYLAGLDPLDGSPIFGSFADAIDFPTLPAAAAFFDKHVGGDALIKVFAEEVAA